MRWCEEQRPRPRHRRRARADRPRRLHLRPRHHGQRPAPRAGRRLRRLRRRLATEPHAVGSVGAGTGATVGKLRARDGWCKGGLGAGRRRLHDGTTVAALAVVNAWGDVLDERGEVLAGAVRPGRPASLRRLGAGDRRCRPSTRAWPRPSTPRSSASSPTARLTRAEAGDGGADGPRGLGAGGVAGAHARSTATRSSAWPPARGRRARSRSAWRAPRPSPTAIRDAVRQATPVRGVPTGADRAAASSG